MNPPSLISLSSKSEPPSSIDQALAWGTEQLRPTSATARLDAELLLAHVLGWSRARLLGESRTSLEESLQVEYRALIARRAALEPVAYVTGRREFYGMEFLVDRHVLVPRPETELLVELAITFARTRNQESRTEVQAASRRFSVLGSRFLIADIGTGSGAIAVAVAAHVPGALVFATDVSPEALRVAQQNVERHGLAEQVVLRQGDLLDALPEPVDLLLSNPPYTILSQIDENVRRHEPHLALDGGPDGLIFYRRLLAGAPAKLQPGGAILLEIGATQAAAVVDLARAAFPNGQIAVHRDLAGLDRVVAISD
ncbi:MAG TPA: peptide chain release factor N(5)-glutamine methyltransferase [Roseiflexaceae bacterium]|nr:peptide chain release factor N(5)-glutamine methyltransferase [Roseiflexaceae bacterium]